jgi:hypothetical protein
MLLRLCLLIIILFSTACTSQSETIVLPTRVHIVSDDSPSEPSLTPQAPIIENTLTPSSAHLGTHIAHLTDQSIISGTITSDLRPQTYTFDGQSGQFVAIEMRVREPHTYPILNVYAPDMTLIATDSESGGSNMAYIRNIQLNQSGTYIIQAQLNDVGGYSVRLINSEQPIPVTPFAPTPQPMTAVPTFAGIPTLSYTQQGIRLTDQVPVISHLPASDTVMPFSMQLTAGQSITIGGGATPGEETRLRFEVLAPDGRIVASADSDTSNADGDTLITPFIAPMDGVYQLFVVPHQGKNGRFIISYGTGSSWLDAGLGAPPHSEPMQSTISRLGQRDVWHVTLKSQDVISIAASPAEGSAIDPIIEIVPATNPNFILAVDDNSGGERSALIAQIVIPEDGTYLIRVRASQANSTGAYNLIWRIIQAAPPTSTGASFYPILTRQDSIPPSRYQLYPFYGRAGQHIRVLVEATDGVFDPVSALISPENIILIEADDSHNTLNPDFTYILPTDGTYNIRVNGYITGGTFRLIVYELWE